MTALARAHYVVAGAFVWGAPGLVAAAVSEALWPEAFAALAAYGAWRGATIRVREIADGLNVRNVLRTFDVPWADVVAIGWYEPQEGFALPPGFVAPWLRVRGRSSRVPVLALASFLHARREHGEVVRGWQRRVQKRA